MPTFYLEPGHGCNHSQYGEGIVLERLPDDKLLVRFQRWDFPDGTATQESVRTVSAVSARICPSTGSQLAFGKLPTAAWVLTEAECAKLAPLARGEWVEYGYREFGIVSETCSSDWLLTYITAQGETREIKIWTALAAASPLSLPVCWVAMPDANDFTQTPPPAQLSAATFRQDVERWRQTVEHCETDFLDDQDEVDHMLHDRTVLDESIAINPVLAQLPEWAEVLKLDHAFRAKDRMPSNAGVDCRNWWYQVGWSIFKRVNQEFNASPRGQAHLAARLAKAREFVEFTAHSALDKPEFVFDVSPQETILQSKNQLPLARWVIHPHFGPGVVRGHGSSERGEDTVTVAFAVNKVKTFSIGLAKFRRYDPNTVEAKRALLARFSVPDAVIEKLTFDAITAELALWPSIYLRGDV